MYHVADRPGLANNWFYQVCDVHHGIWTGTIAWLYCLTNSWRLCSVTCCSCSIHVISYNSNLCIFVNSCMWLEMIELQVGMASEHMVVALETRGNNDAMNLYGKKWGNPVVAFVQVFAQISTSSIAWDLCFTVPSPCAKAESWSILQYQQGEMVRLERLDTYLIIFRRDTQN